MQYDAFAEKYSYLELHSIVNQQYKIEEFLDFGDIGVTVRATDLKNSDSHHILRIVCCSLSERLAILADFRERISIARCLDHPNIEKITSYTDSEDILLLNQNPDLFDNAALMRVDLGRGESLKTRLRRNGTKSLSFAETVRIIYSVARGLAHAHEHRMPHYHIKPANIWLEDSGTIKIINFGKVCTLLPGENNSGMWNWEFVYGNPNFMAPELTWGTGKYGQMVDSRADIYSLGILAFYLVTGNLPFKSKGPYLTACKHLTSTLPSFASLGIEVPIWFEKMILKSTRLMPCERFQKIQDIINWISQHYNVETEETIKETPVLHLSLSIENLKLASRLLQAVILPNRKISNIDLKQALARFRENLCKEQFSGQSKRRSSVSKLHLYDEKR